MPDIYRLGACLVYQDGTYCIPQASTQRPLDETGDTVEVEDLGQVPIACALGVTALPAPPDDNGSAEGAVLEGVGGLTGTCVAAWDVRSADVAGQLSPGDTCLHGTHTDGTKRAKVFCKENMATIIVGNDMVFSMDRGADDRDPSMTLTAWGNLIQVTEDSVKISQGGVDGSPLAWIEIKNGAVSIVGSVNAGGTTALPLVQSAGLVTALGVLASALSPFDPLKGSDLAPLITALAASITATATTLQTTGA